MYMVQLLDLRKKLLMKFVFMTYAGIRYYCRCKFAFSLEIGENYRSSIFLAGGMMLFEAVHSVWNVKSELVGVTYLIEGDSRERLPLGSLARTQ